MTGVPPVAYNNNSPVESLEVQVFRRLAKFSHFEEHTVDTILSIFPHNGLFTEFAVQCIGLNLGGYAEDLPSVDKKVLHCMKLDPGVIAEHFNSVRRRDCNSFRYLSNLYQEAVTRFSTAKLCQLWLLQATDDALFNDSVLINAGFKQAFLTPIEADIQGSAVSCDAFVVPNESENICVLLRSLSVFI